MTTAQWSWVDVPAPPIADVRASELDWWRRYLDHPTAKQRMWALYGARYFEFFAHEFAEAGSTLELGSGPLPVMEVIEGTRNMVAVDPLGKDYAALTGWPIATSVEQIDVVGRWETVLLLNVLDHTDDPRQLIADAHRMARPGGRVLVYVHLDHADERHYRISEDGVRAWLAEVGLTIEREDILRTVFDPPAYACVATKDAISDSEALYLASEAMDAAGVRWWVTCGAALGYHRDGELIAWDHDIDLAVDAEGANSKVIRHELAQRGWECWRRLGTPRDGYVMQFQHPLVYRLLDVYFHYRDGDETWMAVYPTKGRKRYVYPASMFNDLHDVELLGVRVRVPGVDYLEAHYGADWKTPDPAWNWSEDPLCLR